MDDSAEISKQAKMRHSILSKDGTLKYDFMFSLQKIAMARIVSSLWMNQNTQQRIVNSYRGCKYVNLSDFFEFEKDIVAKVSQLLLPNSICQELIYLVSILRNSIYNWIMYHDKHIFIFKVSEYSAVDLIHNISWTTRGKIDYLQTAKNILVNSDSFLTYHHKCMLACTYCLEDEIALLWSMSGDIPRIMIEECPMVYFWAAQNAGDMTQLNNAPYYSNGNRRFGDMSSNKHIMKLLIENNNPINDVPIRFMWNTLSREEKTKNIALLFKNVDNVDFLISLLSNLDYDQQQNLFKECADALLCGILKDFWWWGEYFLPTALNVFDIMDPPSFWKVLCVINENKRMSSQKKMYDHFKSLFKQLWQEGTTQLKEFIFHDNAWGLKDFVTSALNWERDMDVIEVIFKNLDAQQKKNIAISDYGMQRCSIFIQLDEWDLLDLFINCTLSSEDDISHLKQRLIQHSGRKIAVFFLRQRQFHKIQLFMNWAFKSKEEIAAFYRSLNCTIPLLTQ